MVIECQSFIHMSKAGRLKRWLLRTSSHRKPSPARRTTKSNVSLIDHFVRLRFPSPTTDKCAAPEALLGRPNKFIELFSCEWSLISGIKDSPLFSTSLCSLLPELMIAKFVLWTNRRKTNGKYASFLLSFSIDKQMVLDMECAIRMNPFTHIFRPSVRWWTAFNCDLEGFYFIHSAQTHAHTYTHNESIASSCSLECRFPFARGENEHDRICSSVACFFLNNFISRQRWILPHISGDSASLLTTDAEPSHVLFVFMRVFSPQRQHSTHAKRVDCERGNYKHKLNQNNSQIQWAEKRLQQETSRIDTSQEKRTRKN